MSSYNLAIIFWPTLLQPTQDVLMRNEDRTKFSNMVEFLIDNSDSLFGPELPSCPPPDDEDIYDIVFHPELVVSSVYMIAELWICLKVLMALCLTKDDGVRPMSV